MFSEAVVQVDIVSTIVFLAGSGLACSIKVCRVERREKKRLGGVSMLPCACVRNCSELSMVS